MGRPFSKTLREFKLTKKYPVDPNPKGKPPSSVPLFTASDPEAWQGRPSDTNQNAEQKALREAEREAARELQYKVDIITQNLSYGTEISTIALLGILHTKKPLEGLRRPELEKLLHHMVERTKAKMTKKGSELMWTRR